MASTQANNLADAAPDLLAFARSFDIYMRVAHSTPDNPALTPQAAKMWRECRDALAKAERV